MLSERHQDFWGDDCPAVDLDFLMCEYNHGIAVVIVDYKHFSANLAKTNSATYSTLSELYGPNGRQLPFFVARYWPDIWAFKLLAVNDAAKKAGERIIPPRVAFNPDGQTDMTEQWYVRFLYLLRKEALTAGDSRTIARLNNELPPAEEAPA
jgi:hypothetical protein